MAKKVEDNIKVVNNTIGSLSFRDSDGKKYLFPKNGSYKLVPFEIIEGVFNDSESLINGGHIIFPDIKVYDRLGIPEEVYSKLISKEQIEELLEKGKAEDIEETLKDAPMNIKENVAVIAKEKGVDSKSKTKAIKNATGFNVENQEE